MNGFASAQRAYENAEPPDWTGYGVEDRECGALLTVTVTVPMSCSNTRSFVVDNVLGAACDVDVDCDWSGDVTIDYEDGEGSWDCPRCEATTEVTLPPCPFDGKVDVYWDKTGEVWDCPTCGTRHESS